MVTLLDTGLMEFLLPIFTLILVYVFIFALLQKSKFVSENTSTNAFVALAIAVLFAMAPGAMAFISIITPWFVVMVLIAFSLLLVFLFMGVKPDVIEGVAKNEAAVRWTIIIFGIFIFKSGLTAVFGPIFGTPTTEGGGMGEEIQRSIFDPKILATVFILIVIGQAIRLIAMKDTP